MAGLSHGVVQSYPKQHEILSGIRRRITSGEYSPGSQLPPMTELTRQFSACTMTVQRAMDRLRADGFIFSRRREGNYVSAAPPSLCRIGLVFNLPPSADGQWSQYYRAWQAEAERFNAQESSPDGSKRSFSFHSPAGSGKDELEAAVEGGCTAGLIFTMHPSQWSDSSILTKPGIPRVTITSVPVDRIPTITFDHAELLAKGLDWFAANGRRRVAFIIGSSASHADELIAAVAARGMITHRHWVQGVDVGHPHWAATCAETLARLKAAERPDALVIMDDNLVPAATAGVASVGLRVPDDLLVIAHTN
ncbi:MAG TPA: GntR family transcriptional regulator, partial [Planctomycetota bacterium]|nr:GntR family transcriptional regulator [Planctomycetota bacterium]